MKNALQLAFLLETGQMAGTMALSDPNTRRQMTKEQIAFLKRSSTKPKSPTKINWSAWFWTSLPPCSTPPQPSAAAPAHSPAHSAAVHPAAH